MLRGGVGIRGGSESRQGTLLLWVLREIGRMRTFSKHWSSGIPIRLACSLSHMAEIGPLKKSLPLHAELVSMLFGSNLTNLGRDMSPLHDLLQTHKPPVRPVCRSLCIDSL